MPIILGIHNGHHASCAIVKDGILISAIEQERITSIKGDGCNYLSNNLPIKKCLQNVDLSLNEIDLIVSSFQAIGPGGVGFIQPIFEPDFNLFDPFDKRHFVISHHYAHALSAYGTSGFKETAILVSDLAGSTTTDGNDYKIPFSDFYNFWTNFKTNKQTKTECLSIYHATEKKINLLHREYCIPHCSPEIFICSPASLYDNVARFIFNKEDAHGELMALASIANSKNKSSLNISVKEIFEISDNGQVIFNNNWQHKVEVKKHIIDYAPFAMLIQKAFENILLRYVQKTKELTNSNSLTAAGGVFLNIKANSAIELSNMFSHFHVPSSPHDAGIAIGCAYHGWNLISKEKKLQTVTNTNKASDRIGSKFSFSRIEKNLNSYSHLCDFEKHPTPNRISQLIIKGNIIAKFSGAAEFGPRALGNRSLLASPLLKKSKDTLNDIKGRQDWRPVAPIVIKENIHDFFDGAVDSPYMNMLHITKPKHRKYLKAISHPDNSARVQTLTKDDDDFLYKILLELKLLTGYPIIVNTSLNGKGNPILETPEATIDFFLSNEGINYLLIENYLVERRKNPKLNNCKLAQDCIVSIINLATKPRIILLRNGKTMEVSEKTLETIKKMPIDITQTENIEQNVLAEIHKAMFLKIIINDISSS
jgi:carbamoyltransferase